MVRDAKDTTEDYKSLDIRWMAREGLIHEDRIRSVTITWSISGRKTGSINTICTDAHVRFLYTYQETEELDYSVRIDKTPCHYGGVRYWFLCPKCGKRVAILYCAKYFVCRHCLNLTYRSCQEHDKRFSFFRKPIDDFTENDITCLIRFLERHGIDLGSLLK